MYPSRLLEVLPKYAQRGRAVHLVGPPGCGKTEVARQAIRQLVGWGWYEVHGPTRPSEDWGVPVPNAERSAIAFLSPENLPFEDAPGPDRGVIYVDELSQSDNSQQKFYANLFQAREIHGRKIKPGWSFISTGNREKDRAGANRILSHLRDRFTEITMEVSLPDWCVWALANNVPPILVMFHRFRASTGNMLLAPEFDPSLPTKQPTPRSWVEGVGWMMDDFAGAPDELEHYAGAVGEGAAAEFLGFLRTYRSLADPDVVARDPYSQPVPGDPATCYAMAGSLAARADDSNFANIITYGRRMGPEYGLLIVQDAVHRDAMLRKTRAYIEWVTTDGKDLVQAA
jgi:hypothetical protein